MATPVLDARVFAMSDAIGAGRFDQAMAVLSDLYQMNEAPIKILAVLGTQLRQMWSARLALGQKKGQDYLVRPVEAAHQLGRAREAAGRCPPL